MADDSIPPVSRGRRSPLDVDLDRRLGREEARARLGPLQERLRSLQYALRDAGIPTIVLFEGWDAAGKGTVIGRLTEKLDPRLLRVHPGAPPSELERRHHWLWRYQTKLPEDGQIAFFDHSWYGRTLVERVERWVKKRVWRQAFHQIVEFERWLLDDGQVLVKLFFHISRREQRRRLRALARDPLEAWKVQDEDWRRNRRYRRWYAATEEALRRTDTEQAPWTVVEASDARWTRVRVFEAVVDAMEAALRRRAAHPVDVSRSPAAADAERQARADRAAARSDRARRVAEEAGLPLS